MMPIDGEATYRAIDDLKALMLAKFDAVVAHMTAFEEATADIQNNKTQLIAAQMTMRQHEARIVKLEAESQSEMEHERREAEAVEHERDRQKVALRQGLIWAVAGAVTSGVLYAIVAFASAH